MVTVMSLWLPILLSAVFVFVVSSVIHMMLTYHNTDFRKAEKEAELQEALRKFPLAPGDYIVPNPGGSAGMKDPVYLERVKQGPVVTLTVFPPGGFNMGMNLAMWFLYCVVVSMFAAYVTGRAVGVGASYMTVFRFAGVTAFACYAMALWQNTIWYRKSVSATIKNNFDGLVYALVTAGTFGWLWPN